MPPQATCNCQGSHGNPANGSKAEPFYAVTAIINPLASKTGNRKVYVFSSAPNSTLAFEARESNGSAGRLRYSDPPRTPVLKQNSNLVSILVDGLIQVFGVDAQDEALSSLTPVFFPLTNKSGASLKVPTGVIAGCSNTNSGSQGWIYWLDREGDQLVIKEITISSKETLAPLKLETSKKIAANSKLAAFWDGKTKYVVYQSNEAELIVYNTTTKEDYRIQDCPAKEGSPLTAIGAKDQMYIYFVKKNKEIAFVAASSSEPNFRKVKALALADNETVSDASQLAVSVDEKEERNLVYANKEGTDNISAIEVEWSYTG